MKVLHTSDWHLGRTLYGRKRYDEFSAFLQWLTDFIATNEIDALLVAGDIFDTTTPPNKAQELYYEFLGSLGPTPCNTVVITGGNHDSPSFLNAPASFMKSGLVKGLAIHIIGSATDDPADEIIPLTDAAGNVAALVCAVPYLRDRDIRQTIAGETVDDKHKNLLQGIKDHYGTVSTLAQEKCAALDRPVPVIAMGHLFTAKGSTIEGDGVRELYVGSLACVDETTFSSSFDYVALGHLHSPQLVARRQDIRYCGSPIPMGFGEASQEKQVVVVEFSADQRGQMSSHDDVESPTDSGAVNSCDAPAGPEITAITVPRFQELVSITGNLKQIQDRVHELKEAKSRAWLEIEYTGDEVVPDLTSVIDEAVVDSELEVRRIRNRQFTLNILNHSVADEALDDLTEEDVFSRCLDGSEVNEEERLLLTDAFNEILAVVREGDES